MAIDPITRKERILSGEDIEPITRRERILSGEDIEPITRMEYFLKKAISGGGGGATMKTIAPLQTLTVADTEWGYAGAYFATANDFNNVWPSTITVTFNGTEYELEQLSDGNYGAPWVNGAYDWSEYPFCVYIADGAGYYWLSVSEAGTYTLEISGEVSDVTLITKHIYSNGSYYASDDDANGYSRVEVFVPASAVVSGKKTISANGDNIDVTSYAQVKVNVPASAIDSGTKSIATNGTHDVVGYASASVNVPASEVVSGSLSITENGTYDVTEKASVAVDVPSPTGTISITSNGIVDVTDYASAYVSVPNLTPDFLEFDIVNNLAFDITCYYIGSENRNYVAKQSITIAAGETETITMPYAQASATFIDHTSVYGFIVISVPNGVTPNFIVADNPNYTAGSVPFSSVTNIATWYCVFLNLTNVANKLYVY